MLLLSSTTYATEKFGTLNKADAQVLFGQNDVNALALGQNEMMDTEGEWFWVVIAALAFGWASRTPAHAPTQTGYHNPLPGEHGNPAPHLPLSPYGGLKPFFGW